MFGVSARAQLARADRRAVNAMAFKPPVKAGKSFSVRYDAAPTSGGTTLLRVIWIPKHGKPVPDPEHEVIQPGFSGTISGTVPNASDARWLEIWVDLPDGTGKGTLKLVMDASPHSDGELTADTLWTSLVFP